ncbi:MAG: hypothetical protein JO142_02240 [Burkholderiales bacterium]|nr:hypothetical protein [Burkholderiales bacterium]
MAVNGFSVGKDVTVSVNTATGPLQLNLVTGFTAKPTMVDIKVKGLDGITRHVRFPDGWAGEIDIERADSTLDDWWANWEANYYAGNAEQSGTITEVIQNPDGSVSTYRFRQVLLTFDDPGNWRGDSTVKMKCKFVAARREKAS